MRRSGFAVPVVLILMLALSVVGSAWVGLALNQLRVARAGYDRLQARMAAEAAVLAWASSQTGSEVPPAEVGPTVTTGRGTGTATAHSLGRSLVWLEAEGRVHTARRRVGRIYWRPDPVALALGQRAVIETGWSVSGRERVRADEVVLNPDGSSCVDEPDAFRRWPLGMMPVEGELSSSTELTWDAVGPLGWESLVRRGARGLPGAGEPGERSAGLFLVDGDARLDPPGVSGVLVVRGEVELAPEAVFSGWLISEAGVRVGSGARVEGLIRTPGPVRIDLGGQVVGSLCTVIDALGLLGSSWEPLPGRSWLGNLAP